MAEVNFEIQQEFGTISEGKWNLEFNLVSWNDKKPKYDIRSWSPDRLKMGKGITLTKDEILALKTILNNMEL